ncbi:pilus assembly protein N-terminal domain-containing protein [Selenomonas sp. KH1T6]|uniref:type II and III secretion system protein family protein n=1 Tax=Selenomonas sp. KH1T6 TaxID=3158784 RepID=UPI000942364D
MAASCCLMAPSPVFASELISIDAHSSRCISMPDSITQIAIGDPEIATVVEVPATDNEFLLVAHNEGTTSLFVWTASGNRYEYIVGVSPEDAGQAKIIEHAINLPDVHVKMVKGKIMLTGTVENQYERNYAVRTAQLFVKENEKNTNLTVGSDANINVMTSKSANQSESRNIGVSEARTAGYIIDLLHMTHPSQIRLEAQVIAIKPSDTKNLGIVYGSESGSNLFSSPGVFYVGDSYGSGDTTFAHNPWKWATDRWGGINMGISALVTQGRAKILSRPSITTMSGEEAVIQVGGEIPYTTRDSNGTPHTEFKEYGIILQFKPVVDAESRIVTAVHTEVSMPNGESVDGQPVLDRRGADAVVTVASDTTMVIGGLMDSREYKTVRKFPFLGDIPVIGEFFKYTSHTKDKQELIILVTPHLVNEYEASQARMTSEMEEFYNRGRRVEAARKDVDLDAPLPDPQEENASSRESGEAVLEGKVETREDNSSENGSILDKYLNKDVLHKGTEQDSKQKE